MRQADELIEFALQTRLRPDPAQHKSLCSCCSNHERIGNRAEASTASTAPLLGDARLSDSAVGSEQHQAVLSEQLVL
jgi:hypothetical protein